MKQSILCRVAALMLALLMLCPSAMALSKEERNALYDERLGQLLTPNELADLSGMLGMHPGESAYAPCVSPGIVPFDEIPEGGLQPTKSGSFRSSDETIVTVDEQGLLTAVGEGEAEVVCVTDDGEFTYNITVSEDIPPQIIQNYIYVLNREYLSVKRAKLPKYNKYAKWYYGRRKEVGWCSVFTIYCANAAGTDPLTLKQADYENPPMVQFFQQGQVGHQYDGFWDMERFVSVPKPGYLVIYADMSNSYRTVHIGSVSDVQDLGAGKYAVTTVEGNMSNSVKSYCYLYDSNLPHNLVGSQ